MAGDEASRDETDKKDQTDKKDDQPSFTLSPTLSASIALVVAGLAAVGVTGEALTRAIRNEPWPLAGTIIVALISALLLVLIHTRTPRPKSRRRRRHGTARPAERSTIKERGPWLEPALLTVLVIAVAMSVVLGARSIADREQPFVSLQAAEDDKGWVTLTVDIKGAGLRTTDQLLVQVIGLTEFASVDKAKVSLCEQSWAYSSAAEEAGGRHRTIEEYRAEEVRENREDPGKADLLLWDRVGPDRTGAVQATMKLQVSTGTYEGVCAWAPLPDNPRAAGDERNSAAYLHLRTTSAPSTT
jgi:hypothetical protein